MGEKEIDTQTEIERGSETETDIDKKVRQSERTGEAERERLKGLNSD